MVRGIKVKSKFYKMAVSCVESITLIQSHIEGLKEELEIIYLEDGMAAITYDKESTSETYKISQPTESIAIQCIGKRELVEKQIKIYESKLSRINNAIEKLQSEEKKIIRARYIEGKQWYVIAYEAAYSERWCKSIRSAAISNLAIALYGKGAIENHDFLDAI
ncbi:FtsZ-binding cell division protein ZapB [Anaerosolibacter carboniphilus]|uniref:FtsZ-binding cell division protein ZapB n=2 Tax=Anaerosolibacter carboniphilus TaxID=1417629 RepID=A0A841L1Z6_9FIRM|nr:FtsZ-binding cell division protein ZapB [Anaerosolibacter carboniphilus]